jgi:hypothetical protein
MNPFQRADPIGRLKPIYLFFAVWIAFTACFPPRLVNTTSNGGVNSSSIDNRAQVSILRTKARALRC